MVGTPQVSREFAETHRMVPPDTGLTPAQQRLVPPDTGLTASQQMMSSGVGALLVSLVMTPLDVVKIRLQSQERIVGKKCFLYSNGIMDHLCPRTNGDPPVRALHTAQEICNCKWYNRPKYFNGTADAFIKIAKTEGIPSLWSGLSPTLVLALPTTVIYFTTFEQLRNAMHRQNNKVLERHHQPPLAQPPPWIPLLAGGFARVWAVSIVSPLELIRTKMQSQKMAFYQVRTCLSELVRTKGVLGLWNGYTATLLRDVPFSALYWPLFELTKTWMTARWEDRRRHSSSTANNTVLVNFISGAVAGTVASTVTLPFDVIKTIKQIDVGEIQIMGVRQGESKTNVMIAREILQQQGMRGLFAGLTPRILKVAPACAIMISSYEFCKTFFTRRNNGPQSVVT